MIEARGISGVAGGQDSQSSGVLARGRDIKMTRVRKDEDRETSDEAVMTRVSSPDPTGYARFIARPGEMRHRPDASTIRVMPYPSGDELRAVTR